MIRKLALVLALCAAPAYSQEATQLPAQTDLAVIATACAGAGAAALAGTPAAAAFVFFTCIVIGGQEWSNNQ